MEEGEKGKEPRRFPIPIKETRIFAKEHIRRIATVRDLAKMMGYSRSYFSTRVKEYYEKTPAEIIREVRFKKIREAILKYPYETSRAIAERAGLRGGHPALYKFLNTHWDTNFTELRKKLLAGDDVSP